MVIKCTPHYEKKGFCEEFFNKGGSKDPSIASLWFSCFLLAPLFLLSLLECAVHLMTVIYWLKWTNGLYYLNSFFYSYTKFNFIFCLFDNWYHWKSYVNSTNNLRQQSFSYIFHNLNNHSTLNFKHKLE